MNCWCVTLSLKVRDTISHDDVKQSRSEAATSQSRWASESRLGVDPILMDADDQLRLNAFVHARNAIPAFSTDRKEQIVISDAG